MRKTVSSAMVVSVFAGVAFQSAPADEFQPLCDGSQAGTVTWSCWSPVEAADHGGCHVYGNVSHYYHAPPITWSGACRNGRAEGDGVLEDKKGNRAEGHLVAGLKDGQWTVTFASGDVLTESHVGGVVHGPWTLDRSDGRFYAVTYEDGRMQGPWERRDDDGYSEVGTVTDGRFDGIFTITWPNGVEALVPYEEGVVQGEMTVTRNGLPLGTLLYWKGRHVEGVLAPMLAFPDDP
ncbi:MAG: hypothetical protein OXQ84_10430 [bacterium]|nr:hypothetical protein [bacterium]